jgi:two-component system response regulator
MAGPVILLVEDDPADEALTTYALRQSNIGNEIVVTRDGAEALDYLFGRGAYAGRDVEEVPQVVLLDLRLPKVDGFEVLRQIRADERMRVLPVVILTTSNEEDDMVKGYRLGVNSFVRKPVDFDSFMSVVKEMGLYWVVINRCPPGGCVD